MKTPLMRSDGKSDSYFTEGEVHAQMLEKNMTKKTEYVCGFLFNYDRSGVVLVKKTHPSWQKGLLNGIGGHVDGDEKPLEAMHRETHEELGIPVKFDWHPFCVEMGSDYVVHFFRAAIPQTARLEMAPEINPINDSGETQGWYKVDHLKTSGGPSVVGNLNWLIPMALDWRRITVEVKTPHDDITTNPTW